MPFAKPPSPLVAFAAKLLGPFRIPLQVDLRDSRPRALDGLDEVLEVDHGLEQPLRVHIVPAHFLGARVAGRTRRYEGFSVFFDLEEGRVLSAPDRGRFEMGRSRKKGKVVQGKDDAGNSRL